VPVSTTQSLVERLDAGADREGAWGYRSGGGGATEPTALAALALAANDGPAERVAKALRWLASRQRPDGAVPVTASLSSPQWTTSLAVLGWLRCGPGAGARYEREIAAGLGWLLRSRGRRLPPNPEIFDHDTTLAGWSWSPGSYSWVEPTSYALLALRAASREVHERSRSGIELLLDRALPEGGWNYGNRRVLGNVLRPFPAPTGTALAALAGVAPDPLIDEAIAYLHRDLPRIRAPLSLSWGLIGLTAWDAQPPESKGWLEECAERNLAQSDNPLYDALILLARTSTCPLLAPLERAV
jgi:hypothetical protein